jgi:cytochrome P450
MRSNLAIGLQILFGRAPGLLHTLPRDCYTKDIVSVPIGRRPVFIVNHPEIIRRIFTEDRAFYPKSDLMVSTLAPLLGEGVLVSGGERWEHDRKMLEPAFMQMRLEALFPKMREAVDDWVRRLQALPASSVIELESELSRVTADVMFRVLFSQPIDGEEASKVFTAFASFQRLSPQFDLRVVLYSDPSRPQPQPPGLLEEARQIRGLMERLLDQRLSRLDAGERFIDFAQAVIDARDADGQTFSREQMIDQLAVFFLAGHETTASALAWTFFLLSQQPPWVHQLREETDRMLGNQAFGFADFKRLTKARNIVRESLRLYPPVAFLTRRAMREDRFGKLKVPKDSFIVVSPWLVHRHHAYWEHPDRFDPSRFDDDARALAAGTYLPFGLGPRACTGAMVAQLEASLILCEAYRRFDFVPLAPERVEPVTLVSIRIKGGLPVMLRDRQA